MAGDVGADVVALDGGDKVARGAAQGRGAVKRDAGAAVCGDDVAPRCGWAEGRDDAADDDRKRCRTTHGGKGRALQVDAVAVVAQRAGGGDVSPDVVPDDVQVAAGEA